MVNSTGVSLPKRYLPDYSKGTVAIIVANMLHSMLKFCCIMLQNTTHQ